MRKRKRKRAKREKEMKDFGLRGKGEIKTGSQGVKEKQVLL
ncbi:MAG TPA: hypothetical protein VK625_10775 [Flavitalea sp.]|nr:hypothetical protein [Flavitalea sp.]